MQYEHIVSQQQLVDFCRRISDTPTIAFDTEFISEDTYRPELCLVQVAAGGHLAVIDPLGVEDMRVFWELLAEPGKETIVHSGRQEFQFCLEAIGRRPSGWFDVQTAAGFVGMEYPAAYGTLISRLLDKRLSKGETRTNWRRRPLSERQLEYALQDVIYLEPIRDRLVSQLRHLERMEWVAEELEDWQRQLESSDPSQRWWRLSGITSLSPRSLAIVRELWHWRDEEARRRNSPPRRILRDDLIVELARRKSADRRRIRAIRGLERSNLQRHLPTLAERIDRALALPESQCPQRPTGGRANGSQFGLLGQFLNAALGSICRSARLAPTLVGTIQDVRDLIAYRLESDAETTQELPSLARGWRAEVVGCVIEDLLKGKTAIRIADPLADHPLEFLDTEQQWRGGRH